jgi:hypothetical protein
MLIACCYVPESAYPFVELIAITHVATPPHYVLCAYSPNGSPRIPKRTNDENHVRGYWTEWTRGDQLPEAVFSEIGAN